MKRFNTYLSTTLFQEAQGTSTQNADVPKPGTTGSNLHPNKSAQTETLNRWLARFSLLWVVGCLLVFSALGGIAQNITLRISAQPADSSLLDGEEANFEVGVESNSEVTYQWYRNEEPIPGQVTPAFVIPRVSIRDVGYYSLQAKSGGKTVSSRFAKLTLSNRPAGAITFALNSPVRDVDTVTTIVGTNFVAQLLVGPTTNLLAATGPIVPLLSGQLSGRIVTTPTIPPGSNAFAKIRVWDVLAGATYDQARTNGKYGETVVKSYVASQNTGTGVDPRFDSFALYELGEPKIASQPSPIAHTLPIGSNAVFKAVLTGELPLEYQWFFNNRRIEGANEASLVLTNIQAWDTGDYVLEVSNGAGKIRSRASSLSVYATNRVPGTKNIGFNIGDGPDRPILSVVELRDGRLLVGGGFKVFNGLSYPGLVRLHRDGQVDQGFRPAANSLGDITQIWLDSQERIYVQLNGFSGAEAAVKRLNFDGSADASYSIQKGVSGQIYPFPGSGAYLLRRNDSQGKLVKYNEDGLLDPGFELSGISPGWSAGVLPLEDRSVILYSSFGQIQSPGNSNPRYLVKLDPTGNVLTNFPNLQFASVTHSHDRSFLIGVTFSMELKRMDFEGTNLGATMQVREVPGFAAYVLEQANGKLMIYSSVGYFYRANPDGSPDRTLRGVGFIESSGTPSSILLHDGALLCFGRIGGSLAMGKYYTDPVRSPAFLRAVRKSVAGSVTLTLDVQPDMPYLLQRSQNLNDWADVKSGVAVDSVTRLTLPSSGKPFEFYRLITE